MQEYRYFGKSEKRNKTFSWLVKNSIIHLLVYLKLSYLHSYLPQKNINWDVLKNGIHCIKGIDQ